MKSRCWCVLLSVLFCLSACGKGETPALPEQKGQAYTGNGVRYESRFWETPETYPFQDVAGREDDLSEGNIRALFFRGADYKGAETRVFAYLGLPAGADGETRAPGVVLVHGGGGTAYKEWVRAWTDRGYAALAIDYQGNMPLKDCPIDTARYVEIPGFTAPKNVSFADGKEAAKDQWMYWATSAAILANSLLRAQPQVDPARVGIAGISWGSIVTAVTIGYDARFAFAVSIYGGLYNAEAETHFKDDFAANPGALIWDDIRPLQACSVPALYAVWSRDSGFTIRSVARTAAAQPNASLTVRENWYHSHGGGMALGEAYAFANACCGLGRPFPALALEGNDIKLTLPAGASAVSASLSYTYDTLINGGTAWESVSLPSADAFANACPTGWEYRYVSVTDDRGNVVSAFQGR